MRKPKLTSRLYELIAQNKETEITCFYTMVNNYIHCPRGVGAILWPFHPHWIISPKSAMLIWKESG